MFLESGHRATAGNAPPADNSLLKYNREVMTFTDRVAPPLGEPERGHLDYSRQSKVDAVTEIGALTSPHRR